MSLRASLAAVAVVVGTVFVVGCAQTSSPTSPSSSASSSVSGSTSSVQSTSNFAPLLAQSSCPAKSTSTFLLLAELNLVHNLLVTANDQLNRFLVPSNRPNPPGSNVSIPVAAHVIGEGYTRADSVLDCLAPRYPHDPLAPGTDLLTLIIEQANITLDLLVNLPPDPPPPPSIPEIIKAAEHTIFVATTLKYCQKAPCL